MAKQTESKWPNKLSYQIDIFGEVPVVKPGEGTKRVNDIKNTTIEFLWLVFDEFGLNVDKSIDSVWADTLSRIAKWVYEGNPEFEKYSPYKTELKHYYMMGQSSSKTTSLSRKKTIHERKIILDPEIRVRQIKQCITNTCKVILNKIQHVSYRDGRFYYSPEGYRWSGFSVPKEEIIKKFPNATEDIVQRRETNKTQWELDLFTREKVRKRHYDCMQALRIVTQQHALTWIKVVEDNEEISFEYNEVKYTMSIEQLVDLDADQQVETIRQWHGKIMWDSWGQHISTPILHTEKPHPEMDLTEQIKQKSVTQEFMQQLKTLFAQHDISVWLNIMEEGIYIQTSTWQQTRAAADFIGLNESEQVESVRQRIESFPDEASGDSSPDRYKADSFMSPNTHFDKVAAMQQIENALDKSSLISKIQKAYPEIYLWKDGKFDLGAMKTENDFTTAMDILEKLLKRKYPYNNEDLEINIYLYTLIDELVASWIDNGLLTKVREWEGGLTTFFYDVIKSFDDNKASWLLDNSDEIPDPARFRLTRIVSPMDFIWEGNKKIITKSDEAKFNEWYDHQFLSDRFQWFDEIKNIVWQIVKKQNPEVTALITSISSYVVEMFRVYRRKHILPVEWLEKRIMRENLLAIEIPNDQKIYTSEKEPSKMSYVQLIQRNNKPDFLAMIKSSWLQNVIADIKSKIDFSRGENKDILPSLFEEAWLTDIIEYIEKEKEAIKNFFQIIESSIRNFGYGAIIDSRIKDDEYWNTINYRFTMTLDGLKWCCDGKRHFEWEFVDWFTHTYGAENQYLPMVRDISQFTLPQQEFGRFLVEIKHLAPMFVSFLEKRGGEGMLASFKRNAATEYLKSLAPKPKIQNFRAKTKEENTSLITPQIKKNTESLRHSRLVNHIDILAKIIFSNGIEWVIVSAEPPQLYHPASGATMGLPDISHMSENEMIDLVTTFLEKNVSEALLAKEFGVWPSEKSFIEIGDIFDACNIDRDDSTSLIIKKLMAFSDRLTVLNICILAEDKAVKDMISQRQVSCVQLCEYGNEFIKLNFLEWLSEIRTNPLKEPEKNEDARVDDLPF